MASCHTPIIEIRHDRRFSGAANRKIADTDDWQFGAALLCEKSANGSARLHRPDRGRSSVEMTPLLFQNDGVLIIVTVSGRAAA